jgi:tetratricopeptide (TPR) repeat protein
MSRQLVSIFVFSFLLLLHTGCGGEGGGGEKQTTAVTNEQLEQAYEVMNDAYRAAKTDEERLAAYKDFLTKYPESEYTAFCVGDSLYLLNSELGDYDGAVAYAKEIRGELRDAAIIREVDIKILELYSDAMRRDEFRELATRLDRQGNLTYVQYLSMLDGAVGVEAWDLVLDFCNSAKPMANVETYKADHRQLDYTEEEFQAAGNNRRGLLLTYSGWAKANLGNVDEAIADFIGANSLLKKNYFGFADNELFLYWGKALLEKGDSQGAIDKLAPAAFFGDLEDALDPLKQAYLATGGNESGFDDFIWAQRKKLAKTVDDFTLNDYDGQPKRFSDLRGKVTILTFWFPT